MQKILKTIDRLALYWSSAVIPELSILVQRGGIALSLLYNDFKTAKYTKKPAKFIYFNCLKHE